jgi:hypothetical protein
MTTKQATRTSAAAGRRELAEIIRTCEAIAERRFNPFFLDVRLSIETLRKYFPGWTSFEDHCLDARTLNQLAEVLRLQNTQLRFQSSAIYTNPELLKEKIKRMSNDRLASIFLKGWHPIVQLEQLTPHTLSEGLQYWERLLPYVERLTRWELGKPRPPGALQLDEVVRQGVMTREEFALRVTRLWDELKQTAGAGGVEYHEFVRKDDFGATVERAYFVSFLVSFGYARLEEKNGRIALFPNDAKMELKPELLVSFPISLKREVAQ